MMGVEEFSRQASFIHLDFQGLASAFTEAGTTIVSGTVDVIDRNGKLWETYQIEIHPTDMFPFRFPTVFETGGKIPRIGDWHIYENTLACCIAVKPEEILTCMNGITLKQFISNEVMPYLFNQTFRKKEGYYPNGEYSHNALGLCEYYDGTLNTNGDFDKMIWFMRFIALGKKPGRTENCFCGGKEKFRRCHRRAFEKLVLLGDSLKADIQNLIMNFNRTDLIPAGVF